MRCYNGQPDDELQAVLDNRAEVRAEIQRRGYSVTWFPDGEFYQAFRNTSPVGEEHKSLLSVLIGLQKGDQNG